MEVFIANTYDELSRQAAADTLQWMQSRERPLICTASGDTPAGLYKELVARVSENELDISDWSFVGLDEWVGLNEIDEGSCRFHLDNQLFHALNISLDKIAFFDGRAAGLQRECDRVELFIRQHGGIDVAILGLGMNGHIGMNEPGTPAALRSHVTALDPVTQQVGQKYFSRQQQLKDGITLGPATLLASRHIQLLVSGAHKAGIVKQLIDSPISEQLPASLLKDHPGLKIYLDAGAASLLQQ